jgi:predicted MFS family arabinose efflux permease
MWFAAVPLLAASLTRDPRVVSLLELAVASPWVLLGFYAGVLADRRDRRSLMWASDVTRLVIVAASTVLVATDAITVPLLLLMVFALSVISTVFGSAAPALLPDLVPAAELHRANARLTAGTSIGASFVGPALGALLFGLVAWAPFAVDAVTFAICAACVWALPAGTPAADPPRRRSAGREVVEALTWLGRTRIMLVLGAGTSLLAVATGAFLGTFVLFVLEVLRLPAQAYGGLIALYAVGSVAGSAASATIAGRLGIRLTTGLAAGLGAVSFFGVGATASWPLAAAALVLLGIASAIWNVTVATVRQQVTPRSLLGRATSVFLVAVNAAVALGALIGGLLADAYGLAVPLFAASLLSGAAVGALLLWFPAVPTPGVD